MPDSIQDDIRAALDTATEGLKSTGTEKPDSGDFAPQTSETLPPVFPEDKETKAPVRGPDGKFQPKQPAVQPPAPAPPKVPEAPQPLGAQPKPGEELKFDPAKPPAAWTPAMKEKWSKIPEDIRQEITRREEATAVGVQRLQQHYEPMEQIYNTLLPYEGYFEHIQEDPRDYLTSMMQTEQTLRLGNPAQKIELLLALADTYGVPIRSALDSAMNGKLGELMQQAHEFHKTPAPVPPQIMRELQEARQYKEQIEDYAASTELEQFAQEPGHEYLDHVRDDMANLIEAGYAVSYQDAYDLALWRNPQLRPVYIQQQTAAQTAAPSPIQRRQQAAAAIASPGPAPLEYGSEEATGEEDIHDAVRKAWNAQATGRA
jgi:hypothetical protein